MRLTKTFYQQNIGIPQLLGPFEQLGSGTQGHSHWNQSFFLHQAKVQVGLRVIQLSCLLVENSSILVVLVHMVARVIVVSQPSEGLGIVKSRS